MKSIKVSVVSTGVMIASAGASIFNKSPKDGIIFIIVGAFLVGIGIFWIVYQLEKKIEKLEERK